MYRNISKLLYNLQPVEDVLLQNMCVVYDMMYFEISGNTGEKIVQLCLLLSQSKNKNTILLIDDRIKASHID